MAKSTFWLSVYLLVILSFASPSGAEETKIFRGFWVSDIASWGGFLHLRVKGELQNSTKGEINFGNSSCPGFTAYTASSNDKGGLTITTNLGSECGTVVLEIIKRGSKWKGTYDADYPDSGTVELQ